MYDSSGRTVLCGFQQAGIFTPSAAINENIISSFEMIIQITLWELKMNPSALQ